MVRKMERIIGQINFIAKVGQMLIFFLVLIGLCIWPAASIVSSGSAQADNISSENPSSCSWTGNWNTYFGNMTLTQSGNNVVGTYEADSGRINGTVIGNRLMGTWSEAPDFTPPGQAGNLEFNLSDDCNSFSGRWRYGSEGNWSTNWSGTRILPAQA
jgi:hypothetical protein